MTMVIQTRRDSSCCKTPLARNLPPPQSQLVRHKRAVRVGTKVLIGVRRPVRPTPRSRTADVDRDRGRERNHPVFLFLLRLLQQRENGVIELAVLSMEHTPATPGQGVIPHQQRSHCYSLHSRSHHLPPMGNQLHAPHHQSQLVAAQCWARI
ncbi:hypothetical protein BKA93DRAFT_320467 [Sparassis latifolia]